MAECVALPIMKRRKVGKIMKKMIFLLALLVIASPVISKVVVDPNNLWETWVGDDPNFAWAEFGLSYDANGEGNIRAFALDIEVTGPCDPEIDWIWRDPEVDHPYRITPGNISIVDGEIGDLGDVVFFEGPGVPEGCATIEMGSLYEGEAPDPNGTLVGISIRGAEGTTVTVCVSENALRGGIVMEDPALNPGLHSECLEIELPAAYSGCFPLDDPAWDTWDAVGQPDSWCYDCFRCGDATGDCLVTAADAVTLINAWPPQAYDADADFNMSGTVTTADAVVLINHWPPQESCPSAEGCSPCTPIE